MALRVLLADESTTIKKVMQLALQDFAVEVKAVHAGVDVLEVARQYTPDIIFVDVLLQKRNGYEVCTDLKLDPDLGSTPVVLMWSSFMDLDENLASQSGADKRLEKPFDIENLRQIILELVPRTRSQRLAHFLKFPESFAQPLKDETKKQAEQKAGQKAELKTEKAAAKPQAPEKANVTFDGQLRPQSAEKAAKKPAAPQEQKPQATASADLAETKPGWDMNSFEDINDFAAEVEVSRPSLVPSDTSPDAIQDFGSTSAAADSDSDADDEVFSEIRIGRNATVTNAPNLNSDETQRFTPNDQASETRGSKTDDRDPWSHQDLSRFKINLPPVAVESNDLALDFELPNEDEPENSFVIRPPGGAKTASAPQPAPPKGKANQKSPATDDSEEIGQIPQFQLSDFPSDENTTLQIESEDAASSPSRASSQQDDEELLSLESGAVPQLSRDRLEEIIRAQSREIIESVVRRIVPDLASDIIREELQRLLEDTAVRDGSRRESQR